VITLQGFILNGFAFFVGAVETGKAQLAVYARKAGAADDRRGNRGIEPWWWLVSSVSKKAIFPAMLEVEKVVDDSFSRNFSKAAEEVVANDLLRGSGVSVKL
jgi:hypothetical protein